ncbi:MAG: HAD hydrolase-like protein [Alcanivoracaceae bacterium]|nr:HAD hydrolase-like protein [Alcanivoracaceae bacterium]
MYKNIRVIGFDADDTLWINETYFRDAELEFGKLMQPYETINQIDQELFKIEMANLPIYGYGIKGFILSMLETALTLSNNQVSHNTLQAILEIGKTMLNKPVELLDGVEDVLETLSKTHRLIMATKGDLLDQERKLEKSGLIKYFHHIEVLSDKKEDDYSQLLNHLDIRPEEFLMIGNSLKSDILPLINIGAHAIHVPFHITWQHEEVQHLDTNNESYITLDNISDIIDLL